MQFVAEREEELDPELRESGVDRVETVLGLHGGYTSIYAYRRQGDWTQILLVYHGPQGSDFVDLEPPPGLR